MSTPPQVLVGADLFDRGEYFEAHEAWEDHWGSGPREERELMLGLIKAAVALHHLANGNEAGFLWQAKEALPRLRAHGALWPELRIAALAEELESLMAQVRFNGSGGVHWTHVRLRETTPASRTQND